jgi:hypothetical protein
MAEAKVCYCRLYIRVHRNEFIDLWLIRFSEIQITEKMVSNTSCNTSGLHVFVSSHSISETDFTQACEETWLWWVVLRLESAREIAGPDVLAVIVDVEG